MGSGEREIVEQAVRAALQADYCLAGEGAHGVVQGVNRTLAVGPEQGPVAYGRLYRPAGRSDADIEAELAVLDTVVASSWLDVALAMANRQQRFLTWLQLANAEARPMAVFRVATGEPVWERAEDLRAAGAALAELHGQSRLASLAPCRELATGAEVDRTIAQVGDRWKGGRDRLAAAIADLRKQEADRATGPVGFCHGDFRLANLHRTGDRIVMFDFDDCGQGPQWLDLATIGWWLELAAGDEAAGLWRAFLAGYGQAEDTAELREALRWLVAVQHLRSLEHVWKLRIAVSLASKERGARDER
ncbi:phosphotransferase [Mesorhizobium sp. KR1-2]|uniref:phosphotransferase enzyme family protein n=1 Tax=Mesorhizobium sp. KR1-2 TaxID=3156609 RepID=UPI0032B50C6B